MIKKLFILLCLCCIGIGSTWGGTAILTNAQITAGTGSASYGNCSATDGSGNEWKAYAIKNYHSKATSDYNFWQIKKYASSTAYYIQTPEFPGNIQTITLTVSSTSQPMTGGSNTSTLYFSNSKSTSALTDNVVSGTGASNITIDASSLGLKSGYITASGAIRIWDIEVTYEVSTTKYTVLFNAGTNGSCSTTSLTELSAGAGIELPSCTPNDGYAFKGWSTTENGTTADAGEAGETYKPSSNCTLYAVYKALYTVTIEEPENGTLVVKNGDASVETGSSVEEGTTLTIEATPDTGYKLRNWQYKKEGGSWATKTTNFEYDVTSNVSFRANFEELPTYTINYMINGVNTDVQDNVYKGTELVFPTVGEFGGKVFVGWSETEVAETDVKPTLVETTGLTATEDKTYYAVFATLVKGESDTKTDVLNYDSMGKTEEATTYEDWTITTSESGAHYAGNAAGDNSSIQLRTKNNNSGIVSTATGGSIKKISVEWESHTSSGRTLNVYGNNSVYTNPTDLYNAGTSGTLIGTIVYGTSTELSISDEYTYIGLRSNDGAMYLSSVSIEWEHGTPDSYSAYCTSVAPLTQDVTIASSGYSSFSSTYAVTIPEGITAYYATGVSENKVSMVAIEDGKIPANTGAVIKGEAGKSYTFVETNSADAIEGNCLVAVSERIEGLLPEVTIAEVTYKNYVFTQGQFHPFTTGAIVNVAAGKAYLQVVKPADPNAKLEMNFDGGTTGIDAIRSIQVNDNAIYNLRGERVNTMLKGNIYIVNGKKYLVK